MIYPENYDILMVNGKVPDWVDDFDTAYFGTPDDCIAVDLNDPVIVVKFYNLQEVQPI